MPLPRHAILLAAVALCATTDLAACHSGPRLQCTHEKPAGGYFIHKVFGFADDDVWITGNAVAVGVVLHWDGKTLSESLRTMLDVTDIWGASRNDLWVIGNSRTFQHYDGKSWSGVTVPSGKDYRGIWGISARDVWAVGYEGAIVRWNGAKWSTVESGTRENLWAVHGTSANDVWIAGPDMLHWDGKALKSHAVPDTRFPAIVSVWASTPSDAWGVTVGRIVHWDGSSWRQLHADEVDLVTRRWVACCPTHSTPSFEDLHGLGPGDLWAVGGEREAGAGSRRESAVFRWNGKQWTRYGIDSITDISGVWSPAPGKLWIASGEYTLMHCSVR